MMFCDVDGGVSNRDSSSQVRGFSRAKSAKVNANGFGGRKSKTIVIGPFGYVIHCKLYIVLDEFEVGVSRKNCPVIGVIGHSY
jgi:hypothetical protein